MFNKKNVFLFSICAGTLLLPMLGYCDVESTLGNVRDTLINRFMPLVGALGICWAAFSFFTGNPNAKNHLWLAVIGAGVGFGAPSIIELVRSMVH